MRLRNLCWIIVPLVLGGSAYAFRSGMFVRHWANWTGSRPIIYVPPLIELGERKLGEVVPVRFNLANRGNRELVIQDIQVSCACSGLEREVEGHFERIESLRIDPDTSADLVLRLIVRGRTGSPLRSGVVFRTNDPARPEVSIETFVSRVRGGLSCEPASVIFGTVRQGQEAVQMLHIYDDAIHPRSIKSVKSSNPDQFSTELITPNISADNISKDGRRLLGRVNVALNTEKTVPLEGHVLIEVDEERTPDRIPVLGRVALAVEIVPNTIELPRISEKGPVFHATSLCRSIDGTRFTLTVEHVPDGLSVQILPEDENPGMRRLRIECHPGAKNAYNSAGSLLAKLRAQCSDGSEIPLTIRVTLRMDSSP